MKELFAALAAALVLAGCGAGAADEVRSVADVSGAAGARGPTRVSGFLVVEGETARLCELLAESYPPQCGGASLIVEGLDVTEYDTQEASGVRWTDAPVTVRATVQGDALRAARERAGEPS